MYKCKNNHYFSQLEIANNSFTCPVCNGKECEIINPNDLIDQIFIINDYIFKILTFRDKLFIIDKKVNIIKNHYTNELKLNFFHKKFYMKKANSIEIKELYLNKKIKKVKFIKQ